jgi:4-azaleucine resistance transporter AzlC
LSAVALPQRDPVKQGLIDIGPMLVPVMAFGLVFGLAVQESRLSSGVGGSSSWIIFGGAAQLTVFTVLNSGALAVSAIASASMVNARHLLYSVAMSPLFADQPKWFRWVGSYLLVDQVFAVVNQTLAGLDANEALDARWLRRYWITAGLSHWTTWQFFTVVGLVFGDVVPSSWQLDFAISILFLSIVVNALGAAPAVVAAIVGFGVSAAASGLPNRSGLMLGAVVGVATATWIDYARCRPATT